MYISHTVDTDEEDMLSNEFKTFDIFDHCLYNSPSRFKWSELPCNQKYLPSIYPVCHSFCSKCKCKSHPRSDWNSQVMMLEGCSQFNGTRRYFITAFILQCSDSNVILLKQSHNLLLPTSNKDSALTIILMLTLLWYICLMWLARVSLVLFMPKLFLKSGLIFSDLQARMRVQSAITAILASSLSVWWGSFWKKKEGTVSHDWSHWIQEKHLPNIASDVY